MRFITPAILACLILSNSLLAQETRRVSEGPRKPNVVIFLTDDQGTLDVNCYGSKDLYTPHMDKLARTGVRFTQAYAHAVCCPARAALMTGRHPQRSGVNHWTQQHGLENTGVQMAREEITITEMLKAAGYQTALSESGISVQHPVMGRRRRASMNTLASAAEGLKTTRTSASIGWAITICTRARRKSSRAENTSPT